MKLLILLTTLILLLSWCNIPKEEAEIEVIECGGRELVYDWKYPKFSKCME